MVQIYKLRPPTNRICVKTEKSKLVCKSPTSSFFISWYAYHRSPTSLASTPHFAENKFKEKWNAKELGINWHFVVIIGIHSVVTWKDLDQKPHQEDKRKELSSLP